MLTSKIDVEGAVESQGGGDRGHDLANQPVQVGVGRPFNVQVAAADIVDGFVVDHEGAVGVFQGGVGSQDGVVWLNHCGRDLREKNCENNASTRFFFSAFIFILPMLGFLST